jgi:hypothetical protein
METKKMKKDFPRFRRQSLNFARTSGGLSRRVLTNFNDWDAPIGRPGGHWASSPMIPARND